MVKNFETLMFDANCTGWSTNKDYNKLFIENSQDFTRVKCEAIGWISLNDVYKILGAPLVLEAQVVGWKKFDEVEFELVENPVDSDIRIIFKNLVKLL